MNTQQMTGKMKFLSITTHLADELVVFAAIMDAALTAVSKQDMAVSYLHEQSAHRGDNNSRSLSCSLNELRKHLDFLILSEIRGKKKNKKK